MSSLPTLQDNDNDYIMQPSRADVKLMQEILPYYAEIAEQGDHNQDEIALANSILASIAFRTGDYQISARYYRRAYQQLQVGSVEYIHAVMGLIQSLYMQKEMMQVMSNRKILHDCIDAHLNTTNTDVKIALLQCILLTVRENKRGPESAKEDAYLQSAAEMIQDMSLHKEAEVERRLMQAEFLLQLDKKKERHLFVFNEEKISDLLAEVLKLKPNNAEAKRIYLRHILHQQMRMPHQVDNENSAHALNPNMPQQQARRERNQLGPRRNQQGAPLVAGQQGPPREQPAQEQEKFSLNDLKKGSEYAQALLVSNPSDLEAMYFFLAVRGRYTDYLAQQGKTAEAELENERTLGVLGFLLMRSDFSTKDRKSLIMMMAPRPGTSETSVEQREKELMIMMRNFDSTQVDELRARMKHLQERNNIQGPRNGPQDFWGPRLGPAQANPNGQGGQAQPFRPR